MKGLKRSIFFIAAVTLSLLTISATAVAGKEDAKGLPIKVSSEVDSFYVGIGDRITYSITVSAKKDVEIEPLLFKDEIGGLTIRDFDSQEKKSFFGKKIITHKYILTSYKPGPYTIPAGVVKFKQRGEEEWREVKTDEITIAIKSALEGQKALLDVRDIKGPVQIKGISYFLSFVAVALIILAAIAGVYIFARKKIKRLAAPPPKPAHILAYEALERLSKSNLLKEGMIKEYYIKLSDIVRHYLESRFDLRAPEMTTEEFLVEARDAQGLLLEDRNLLRDFMLHCDLVKFAKYGPSDTEVRSSSGSAKKLIDRTRPKEANGVPR